MPAITPVVPVRPGTVSVRGSVTDVRCSDPAMKATVNGNLIRLDGIANNRGIVQSSFSLKLDGKAINVLLTRGMSPTAVYEALEKQLPKGYQLNARAVMPKPGTPPNMVFTITYEGTNSSKQIEAAFAKAGKSGSASGSKLTVAELRTALKAGLAGDGMLNNAEKQTFAKAFANTKATAAAQKEYARLQMEYGLL